MNNLLLKRTCLAAAVSLIPVSQAALAEVSISGWINEAAIYYDDGQGSDIVQVADNGTTLGSRITFAASSELPAGLKAGMELILEPLSAGGMPLLVANQATFKDTNGQAINILGSSVFLSGAWGKVTMGLQTMPTDNIAVLSDPSVTLWDSNGVIFRGNGFNIRGVTGTHNTWGSFFQCQTINGGGIGLDCNGIYRNGVRYDLPTFVENLQISAGWANDDVYDVAGKWSGQLGRLKALLGMGYAVNNGVNTSTYDNTGLFQVQGGLMDPVTGLFVTVAYQNEDEGEIPGLAGPTVSDTSDVYWVKGGIKKKFNSLGDTAITFQYGSYNDQFGNGVVDGITGSEVQRVGASINQYFGSSLIIYGAYENLSLDVSGSAATHVLYDGAQDLDLFSLGAVFFY